jgi:uncharacterized protein (DUF1810 family)
MEDPYQLRRFVEAQEGVYQGALSELRDGAKLGHWMWFIFPQAKGLGRSERSRYYGIGSLGEARAYLQHPLLGSRLLECAQAVLQVEGRTARAILGGVDAVKLKSSMTLFARAEPEQAVFRHVLDKYYEGDEDQATIRLLQDDA